MYLKEIKAQGFKSFAETTKINFDEGLTGIVGPNGSGKSNIVDAVRWVLGEQSVKSLRGGYSMTDVIFSGTKKRKSANIASVTLVFDNSDKYVPIDNTEISIKRKVYRDGTNEYYLNNQQCRLKDITDLLLDSGIAKESFNIIGQGKIEDIISTKPADRKIIFEEAAGVLKYKKRKEETLRKLDKTNESLIRVEDIIVEIESRLKPLEREKNKALKYIDLKKDLTEKEIALLAKDINDINEEYKSKQKKFDILEKELITLNNLNVVNENSLTKEKHELEEIQKELVVMQQKMLDQITLVEKINSEKQILLERKKYKVDEQKLHNNVVLLKENELKLKNQISKLNKEKETIHENIEDLIEKKDGLENKINEFIELKNNFQIELSGYLREEQILKNKIERLQESIDNNSFMPASVAKVLNNKSLKGVEGTLGSVIEVDESHSIAITTSLGAASNNVIVTNEDVAKEAINYLKINNLGRVTFLPMNIIESRNVDSEVIENIKGIKGFIDVASKLIKYNKKYKNIVENVLGRVIIVDNIDNANNIANKLNYKFKIVTLDGELLNVGGSITGGKVKHQNLITEKIELEQSILKLKLNDENIKTLEEKINKTDFEYRDIESKIFENKSNVAKYESKLTTLEETIKKYEEEVNVILDELKGVDNIISSNLDKEEEKIIQKYYDALKQKDEINHKIVNLNNKKDQLDSYILEKEGDYKIKNHELFEKSKLAKTLEIEVNRLDVKLENSLNYLSETYNITFEYAYNNYKITDEIESIREVVSKSKEKLEKIGFVNLNAPAEFDEVNERYVFLTSQKKDLRDSEDNLLKIIEQLDKVMKKEFVETFDKIQVNFKSTFKELFKGGEAYLEMTDPNNILETGIEIVAQPPGKKLSNINLLSGGEKTFTAISLLFAILKTKPVPFCVFDEVEAALDDVNVEAFGEYITKLKSKTQFILITHKKKTMEFVDLLYGITMQESGVSKLVSVRLADLD